NEGEDQKDQSQSQEYGGYGSLNDCRQDEGQNHGAQRTPNDRDVPFSLSQMRLTESDLNRGLLANNESHDRVNQHAHADQQVPRRRMPVKSASKPESAGRLVALHTSIRKLRVSRHHEFAQASPDSDSHGR